MPTLISKLSGKIAAIFMVIGAVFLFSTAAQAKEVSVCKGLSKGLCESNDGCSHVSAFTRSDGAKVKAHCRAKPGNSAKKKDTSTKKTTKKDAKSKTADAKKDAKSKAADAKKDAKSTKKTAKSKATDAKKTAKTKKADAKKTASKAKKTTTKKAKKTTKKVKKAKKKKVGS